MNSRSQNSEDKKDPFKSRNHIQNSIQKTQSDMVQYQQSSQKDEIHSNKAQYSLKSIVYEPGYYQFPKEVGQLSILRGKGSQTHLLVIPTLIIQDLLNLIMASIDPQMDIKSFQDERLALFLKKMGCPFSLSKTRMISLGSFHSYIQTVHLLSWISSIGDQIHQISQASLVNPTDDGFDDILLTSYFRQNDKNYMNEQLNLMQQKIRSERQMQKMKKKVIFRLAEHKKQVLIQLNNERDKQPNISIIESQIEDFNMQIRTKENQMKDLEVQFVQLQKEEEGLVQNLQNKEYEIHDLQIYNQQLQDQIDKQPIDIYQANDMVNKTQINGNKIQTYLEEIIKTETHLNQSIITNQESLKNIDSIIFNINHFITVTGHSTIRENLQNLTLPTKFNLFDTIPIEVQLRDTTKGFNIIHIYEEEEDNLLGNLNFNEHECLQKIIEDRTLEQNKKNKGRKSVQIYDIILKRDTKRMVQLMIPQHFKNKAKGLYTTLKEQNAISLRENDSDLKKLKDQFQKLNSEEISLSIENQQLQSQLDDQQQKKHDQQQFKLFYSQQSITQRALADKKIQLQNEITRMTELIPKLNHENLKLNEKVRDQQDLIQIMEDELEQIENQNNELFQDFKDETIKEILNLKIWMEEKNKQLYEKNL